MEGWISFANPWGALALLGVPIILAIHFLQRTSRRFTVSTLFLLEQLEAVSASGRRFDRLRNSVPLWLQIAAVLLATWLLVQPRILRKDSEQIVIVVLDSSVSMSAFHDSTVRSTAETLARFKSAAAHTQWILLETDPAGPTLYSGDRFEDLVAAAAKWRPKLGTHEVIPALREATALARGGSVVFVTDHPVATPPGVALLAVGKPVANCGFCGLRCENDAWHAVVRNYGGTDQTRSLSIDGQAKEALKLPAGAMIELSGTFRPDGRCELRLGNDAFEMDDVLPIVKPVPKPLKLQVLGITSFDIFFQKFNSIVEAQRPGGPTLTLVTSGSQAPPPPAGHAVIFVEAAGPPGPLLTGDVAAEIGPLTEGLVWDGLQCRDVPGVITGPSDRALVWQAERPLLFLRETGDTEKLIVNFDLRHSNAERWPAFIVLLHRFAESVRASGTGEERVNAEPGQPISNGARAPSEPGFFESGMVKGAVHFADVREADFRKAATLDVTGGQVDAVSRQNRRDDPLAALWVLVLGAVLMANWHLTGAAGPLRNVGPLWEVKQ